MSTNAPWGEWRFTAGGVDITRFRNAPTSATFQSSEPFGSGPATLRIPKLTPFDLFDVGGLEWTDPGSPVDIVKILADGTHVAVWSGEIAGREPQISSTAGSVPIPCLGDMEAASLQMHQPQASLDPVDIGHAIASELNGVIGRRYHALAAVDTGIMTTKRGADDQSHVAYCQELLADACTSSGNQWTVKRVDRRTYVIVLKDKTTVHIDMHIGLPGIFFNLKMDATKTPTRIFGSGVTKDGFSWSNMFYPGSRPDDAPAYPYAPTDTITIGTSGSGVSKWQRRVNELNITPDITVDGVYNSNDATAARAIQRYYGLLVDGIVGPQTWAATFDVGGGARIGSMIRRPLAMIDAVEPELYNADGSTSGPNPTFDSSLLCVDLDVNFGAGVSKKEGMKAAENILKRDFPPGYEGDIEFSADTTEMQRFDIEPGMNVRLKSLRGFDGVSGPLLHIAGINVDTDRGATAAVSERAHDLLTLIELRNNREQAVNPARLPKDRRSRRSTQSRDAVIAFDGESRGGIIPEFALYAGLWSVIRIPVAQSGRIAKVRAVTESATPFAMAIFGAPIQPNDINSIVGNPLASDNPWEPHKTALEDAGWVEGWGSSLSKCGVNRSGDTTGVFEDEGSLEFRSLHPPVLWLAFRASGGCRVHGRLYPAPLDA